MTRTLYMFRTKGEKNEKANYPMFPIDFFISILNVKKNENIMHNNHFNFWFRQPMILRHFNSTGKIQNPQGIVKRAYCFKKTTQRKGWLQSFRFAKLNHPPAIRQDILQFQWLHFLGKKKIKQMSTEKNPFCLSEKPVSNTNLFFSFHFFTHEHAERLHNDKLQRRLFAQT